MKQTADGLAALGRYGDSTLVHMSPREVAGLQAFAKANGTSLTVNPHTGLPEAFSLESLLPTIAGAGLMMIPGMQPLAAGLIVGAAHGVATGFKNPLQSAMAGLGGYGGAGIGQGLSAAGAAAQAAPTASTAMSYAPVEAASNMTMMPAAMQPASDTAASSLFGGEQLANMAKLPPPGPSFEAMGKGLSGMVDTGQIGTTARDAFMGKVDGFGGLAKMAGSAAAPVISDAMELEQMGGTKPISTIRPYEFQRNIAPGAFDDVTDSRERRYFEDKFIAKEPYQLARGGLAAFARGGKAKKFDPLEQRYEMVDFRNPQAMQKKTMGMYQYAVGGKAVSGPGDGMSDDVKANIDGVREARLSDGEFVIPADVVSGLGNGSTDAGSKQLRAMMDRVRQKRTGRKQQAPQIKVKGLMPA